MLPSLSIILLIIYHTDATAIYPSSLPLRPLTFPPPMFPVSRPIYPMSPSLPPRPLPPPSLLPLPLLISPLLSPPSFKPRSPILPGRRYNPKLKRTFRRHRQFGPSRLLSILRPAHPMRRPKFNPFQNSRSKLGLLRHQQIIKPHMHRMINIIPRHRIQLFNQIQQPFPAHLIKFGEKQHEELNDRLDDFGKRGDSHDIFRDRNLIDDDFERRFAGEIISPIIPPPRGAESFGQLSTFNTFAPGASTIPSRDDQFGRNGAHAIGSFQHGQRSPQVQQSGQLTTSGSVGFGSDSRDIVHQNINNFAQYPEYAIHSESGSFKSTSDGFDQDSFHQMHQLSDNVNDLKHDVGLNNGHLGDTFEQGFDRHFETGFDGAGGNDGFINDNFQSVAHMIPHAEPVFETNTGDGFLPDSSDIHERDEKKDSWFDATGHNADDPIEGLQLLGNSRWSDIINELASVVEHGIATPMDIPGEPVVVYPVNPYTTTKTGQVRIPGDSVVLVPKDTIQSHPTNDGPFAVETLDTRPNGLGHNAFAMLGIDPSTIDNSQFYPPMREVVDFTVTDAKLVPEHPPPIPLPPRLKPETPPQQDTQPVNIVEEKTKFFAPSFSVKDRFTAIEALMAADVVAKTFDEIGS